MANDRKGKKTETKNFESQMPKPLALTAKSPKGKVLKKPGSPSSASGSPLHNNLDELPDSPQEDDKNGTAGLEWPKSEDIELFKKIRSACPKDDTMKYESRVNNLDWEKIKLNDRSATECKERWIFVQRHLRHYRLLGELLDDAIVWLERPWFNFNKGSKSSKRHPDEPKKPLTSYMLFYMEQRDAILEKQPGLGMTELSKVIAGIYHELNDRKKQKYLDLAERERELYNEKMKKFTEDHPEYAPVKSGKLTTNKVPPKMPTPFKLFSDIKMAEYLAQGKTPAEAREHCRDAYKELTEKKKLKWIYKAVEQEAEYHEQLKKFREEHPEVEISSKKASLLSKEEIVIKHRSEGKPEKPPNSGYSLFSTKMLSSDVLKNFETKDRMTEISKMWKELSEEEQGIYNEQAQQLNHTYKMNYASYLETLTAEQRDLELGSSAQKGVKRSVAKNSNAEMAGGKKLKKQVVDDEGTSGSGSEDDNESPGAAGISNVTKKPPIQKPKSSLQMFCDTNMVKFSVKHPKLSQQELRRLLAKEFAKLSEDKKKVYGKMAQKSRDESPPKTSEVKTKSKGASQKTGSKELAGKSKQSSIEGNVKISSVLNPAKSVRGALKPKPSLNANAKSSAKTSKTTDGKGVAKMPTWVANQTLYKNEPPKPPENPVLYYATTLSASGKGNPSASEVEQIWEKLPEKQKKKFSEEHKKKQKQYVVDFENFVRTLPTDELRRFRSFMKNREKKADVSDVDGTSSYKEDDTASSEEDPESISGDTSDESSNEDASLSTSEEEDD